MSEESNDRIDELESQMEVAGSLIKSLEEEVESLRRDLEQASLALRMAQQEVSARERALEERDSARIQAEQKAEALRDAMTELRIRNSDEQLQLRNQHIAELARMQDRFGAQRIADMEKTLSGDDTEVLREEYQRDLQELERRHQQEIEALESSYQEWKDRLRQGERELREQHEAEVRDLRREAEAQRRELQRELRQEYDRRLEEALQSAQSRHEEEVEALREGYAQREQKLQNEYRTLVEEHRSEMEVLRIEAEQGAREAEEKRQRELREIKALAEKRERELRRGQSGRIQEANDEAERRIASLQAQRKADNEALKSRYEKELALLRQEHEERLAAEEERRRHEVMSLEEKFESVKLERTSEARAYIDRLKELETTQPGRQNGHGDKEPVTQDRSQETTHLRERVAELEEALASSRASAEQFAAELEELRSRPTAEVVPEPNASDADTAETEDHDGQQLETSVSGGEERVRELEIQLRETQEERRHYADELGKVLDRLRHLSDPEHRLRAGIATFNESPHARNVASISKALGLPDVHAGVEGDSPGKPTFTFVWGDISWRRYVSEPIEGLEVPRVYLVASGDDPEEAPPPEREANARIDARGHLILGIQAR